MMGLRFLGWIIVPIALVGIYLSFGLPHVIWSRSWVNNGTYDPFAPRFYTRCTFTGAYGEFTIHHPQNGKCSWIIFRKQGRIDRRNAQKGGHSGYPHVQR